MTHEHHQGIPPWTCTQLCCCDRKGLNLTQIETGCVNRPFRPQGRVEQQTWQAVSIGAFFCVSESDLVWVSRLDRAFTIMPLLRWECWDADPTWWWVAYGQWVVYGLWIRWIFHPYKNWWKLLMPNTNDCQCFSWAQFFSLCVSVHEYSQFGIQCHWISLRDNCSYPIHGCVCSQVQG